MTLEEKILKAIPETMTCNKYPYPSEIKGIEEAALAAGLRGDEVTMHIANVLEKNGRYDLLPPCYCKGDNE